MDRKKHYYKISQRLTGGGANDFITFLANESGLEISDIARYIIICVIYSILVSELKQNFHLWVQQEVEVEIPGNIYLA